MPPNQTAPAPPPISFSSQNAIVLNKDDQQINCYIHVCVIATLISESSKTAERGQAVIDRGRDGGLFCRFGQKQTGHVVSLIQEMVLSGFYSTSCLPGYTECRISQMHNVAGNK